MKKIPLIIALFSVVLFFPSCEFLKDSGHVDKSNAALRNNLVKKGKKQVGTKYKYAGKQPRTGFDCSGFTSYVYKEHELSLSPSSKTQGKQGAKIPLKQAQPGDLVFFSRNRRTIFHVAMVVSNNSEGITVVHSTSSKGVIIQNISKSKYWKPKILFARDIISSL